MMVIGILYELHNAGTVDGQVVGIGLQVELDHSTITKVVLQIQGQMTLICTDVLT